MQMNRRDAIKVISLSSAALITSPWGALAGSQNGSMLASLRYPYQLPDLPYDYAALAAFIDAETMTLHHTKHHAGYVTNLNKALESQPELQDRPLIELLKHVEHLPESVQTAVRNHGGGHANHSLFWQVLNPGEKTTPDGKLAELMDKSFGSLEACVDQLRKTSMAVFGSGWSWLVYQDDALAIASTPNQDSPIMAGKIPLFGIDVWEHAYYLRYQNRRADYVNAILEHINWPMVAAQLPA